MSMNYRRDFMGVQKVGDKIYVFGGCPSESNNKSEVYFIKDNAWIQLDDLPHAIRNGSAGACQNKIYITNFEGTITIFDIETSSFSSASFSVVRGGGHIMFQPHNGLLYICRSELSQLIVVSLKGEIS
jgi:hypothetical protein